MSLFKKHIFLTLLLMATLLSNAQVTANFNAALYGRSLDGLAYVQLINASTLPVYAKLKITVSEMRQGSVATVKIPFSLLKPGMSTISRQTFIQSSFVFANSNLANTVSSTNKLPEGEYEFCFEISVGDAKTQVIYDVTENCFQSVIEPMAPLLLVDPMDGDEICNTRPNFTWQSPMPLQKGTQFRIVVCEQNKEQAAIEAITYNLPIINISALHNSTLIFPPKTPDLKKGIHYVWQVIAYQEKTILTKSEIWEFEIKCEETKPTPVTDSYRELKELEDGNYYVANKLLRISFTNPYNPGILNYAIVSMDKPDKKISKMPALKLGAGLNKYEIDLTDNDAFKEGQEYMITVWLPNSRTLKLRFIYTNK